MVGLSYISLDKIRLDYIRLDMEKGLTLKKAHSIFHPSLTLDSLLPEQQLVVMGLPIGLQLVPVPALVLLRATDKG